MQIYPITDPEHGDFITIAGNLKVERNWYEKVLEFGFILSQDHVAMCQPNASGPRISFNTFTVNYPLTLLLKIHENGLVWVKDLPSHQKLYQELTNGE